MPRIFSFFAPLLVAPPLLALALPAADPSPPSARIAKFSGDRAAAISYTFDDGLRDQYTLAAPMLDEVGFKGTFFVIPGKVSSTTEDAETRKNDKRAWGTITWAELREMAARGHEIANHTWSHRGLAKLPLEEVAAEFSRAAETIAREIGRPPMTLAFPFNQSTPEIQALALRHHVAYRSRQLGVGGEKSTLSSLNAWAEKQVGERTWGVVMAHGIGRGYAAFTDPNIFREHLRHVKSRGADIWVDSFANVARYEKERDDAKLTLTASAPGRLVFTLTGDLDSVRYDVPLTVVIETPAASSTHAERAGRELPTRVLPGAIHIDATPAPEPITLLWK